MRLTGFAHCTKDLGVGRGSVVGICLDRTPELMMVILGVLKAGAAYAPLDPSYPAERLRLMVSQLDEIKINVVSAETRDLLDSAPVVSSDRRTGCGHRLSAH